MKKAKLLLQGLVLIILLTQVSAVTTLELKPGCDDKGIFTLEFIARDIPSSIQMSEISVYVDNLDTNKALQIEGEWDTTDSIRGTVSANIKRYFTTKEMVILDKGLYQASISYPSFEDSGLDYVKQKFVCPGYYFSCDIVNVSVVECYNDGKMFYATIKGKGLNNKKYADTAKVFDRIKDVSYSLRADERYIDIDGGNSTQGNLPKNYFLYDISEDVFEIRWSNGDNYIQSMSMIVKGISECNDKSKYTNTKISDTTGCFVDEALIKAKEPCAKGCVYDKNLCLPFGSRFTLKEIDSYCSIDNEIKAQKKGISFCSFSYECESKLCKDGRCDKRITEEKEETQKSENLPEEKPKTGFFRWFMNIFK